MAAVARRPLRVANSSGFYGDRFAAPREMLEGGAIDVLTGDYLAELTLVILGKAKEKDPSAGYAQTFLRQMEDVLRLAKDRGVRVVTNAGGLNPGGLAARLRELAARQGVGVRVAHVEGDDLRERLADLQAQGHELRHLDDGRAFASLDRPVLTANAYLGGWGIARALAAGADVVVCGRVSDASLVVGPAAWHFAWKRDDWDALAGAVVAGHVVECGAQATGGNYAFFREVQGLEHPGFPIAEMHEDGSCVITKHPGTGGEVSVGTVTAQLLYEIEGARYKNPDVVARFDTIRLEDAGKDRVRIYGVRGEPAPESAKVGINYLGGYRNTMTLVLTGLDVTEKAGLVRRALFPPPLGEKRFASVDFHLVRSDREDAPTTEAASALLRITVRDPDPRRVGRAFSGAAVELALASYPGFFATSPPGEESAYGVFWPAEVPVSVIQQVVVTDDGRRLDVEGPARGGPVRGSQKTIETLSGEKPARPAAGPLRSVPLGLIFGARSGDKAGNANVGVWARTAASYAWLDGFLTVERFRQLVPESAPHEIARHALPNFRALNFVVRGLLDEGVAASTRFDPQAKALGELLRSRVVEIPESLLELER
jgi:Acyclic terpene utilisation family protein AtuA